jgi:hypothetical protein
MRTFASATVAASPLAEVSAVKTLPPAFGAYHTLPTSLFASVPKWNTADCCAPRKLLYFAVRVASLAVSR